MPNQHHNLALSRYHSGDESGKRSLLDSSLWFHLLLDEASKTTRVVHGCPPAPRLVGIEPNPGPVRDAVLAATAQLGAALGSAVARTQKKKQPIAKTKRKKKKTSSQRLLGGMGSSVAPIAPSTRMSGNNAAVSRVPTIRSYNRTAQISLPFSVSSCIVLTNTAGAPAIVQYAANVYNLPFDPNSLVGSDAPFGANLRAVSACFSKYRFRELRLEYHPLVPTSTVGAFCMAVNKDGGINRGVAFSYNTVSSCTGSVSFPVWESTIIPTYDLDGLPLWDNDWKYTHDSSASVAADERQENAGCLLLSTPNTLSASTSYGTLRISGIVDLQDMSSVTSLHFAQAKLASSRPEDPAAVSSPPAAPNTPLGVISLE